MLTRYLTEVIKEGYKMVFNFDENKNHSNLPTMSTNSEYIHDQTIEHSNKLTHREYDNCNFNSCNFENYNLSEIKFMDCTFNLCNLSLANVSNASLQNVKFNGCKMLGVYFDSLHPFGLSISFSNCLLNHSSFYGLELNNITFKNSKMHEVDFAEANLTAATFDNCDLLHAVFDRTILVKADFRTAINYAINPEINRIRKAKFAISGLPGLLQKYQIDIEE